MSSNFQCMWHGSRPDKPKNGDCYYDADESIVFIFKDDVWYQTTMDHNPNYVIQLIRDKQILGLLGEE